MPRFSRCLAVLLLVLFVLPAVLQAAEPRRDAVPVLNSPAAQSSWVVLAQVWSFLTGAQLDNGCLIEPNGRCLAGQRAAATVDNGCRIEPDGRCNN